MRNSGDRQARSRLARQRPGPQRIRRRTSGARTGWRRIPWVHVGTIVGATAAVGGLIFTGIATYYSAKIASDQLQQSRDDAETKERAQAEQVSFYVGGGRSGREVHLVNRSLDPIYSPKLLYSTDAYDAGHFPSPHLRYKITGGRDVGPCSELVFNFSDAKRASSDDERRLAHEGPTVALASFTDRAGKRWYRTPTGLTTKPDRVLHNEDGMEYQMAGEPEMRRLEVCGDQGP